MSPSTSRFPDVAVRDVGLACANNMRDVKKGDQLVDKKLSFNFSATN